MEGQCLAWNGATVLHMCESGASDRLSPPVPQSLPVDWGDNPTVGSLPGAIAFALWHILYLLGT